MGLKNISKELDILWHKAILKKFGYRCFLCGSKDRLQSHHIISRVHKSTRWDLRNGVCLCAGHHYWAHREPLKFHKKILSLISEQELEELLHQSEKVFDKRHIEEIKNKLEEFLNEGKKEG